MNNSISLGLESGSAIIMLSIFFDKVKLNTTTNLRRFYDF
jgi:ABC-type proline/glycine betaine transport system permease subunit